MKEVSGQPVIVVLRRCENESISFVAVEGARTENAVCRVAARQAENAFAYHVSVPDGFAVLPVDWRRFAYDHEKVKELLARCIQDNVSLFLFDAWSEDTKQLIEKTLRVALADLNTIFDTKYVECSSEAEDVIRVEIRGEHKNGHLASVHCRCSRPSC